MSFKKGDHVRVVKNAHGQAGPPYGTGATGIIEGFRTNRFHGRQAIVVLDSDPTSRVDWTLTDIEKV